MTEVIVIFLKETNCHFVAVAQRYLSFGLLSAGSWGSTMETRTLTTVTKIGCASDFGISCVALSLYLNATARPLFISVSLLFFRLFVIKQLNFSQALSISNRHPHTARPEAGSRFLDVIAKSLNASQSASDVPRFPLILFIIAYALIFFLHHL